jgi:hypothetical protein
MGGSRTGKRLTAQITYRVLARTAKIHVNEAKQMLHSFHASQEPGAVHAVYVITGFCKAKPKVKDPRRRPGNWEGEMDLEEEVEEEGGHLVTPEEGEEARLEQRVELVGEDGLEGQSFPPRDAMPG